MEDAVDEIGLLKTRLEKRDRDVVADNEKHAALSKECKGRGKKIAALPEAVANLKKGRRDKEVEKAMQTDVKGVLVAGTQTERRTYASILAQTEKVSIGGENTDKIDVDTPPPPTNTPTSPAATPSANTTNATPTSAHLARAFGRRGGGVIGVQWLLQSYRRRGKTFSSLVVFVKRAVQTAADMYVRVKGRKHKVEEYKWDRKSTKLDE